MKYEELSKEDLIKRIRLLENMEIGVSLFPEDEMIIIDPDKKIKGSICIIQKSSFDNPCQTMFAIKCGSMIYE